MSSFEHLKQKRKGNTTAGLPTCRKCGKTSILSPCRVCATPEEAEKYPELKLGED